MKIFIQIASYRDPQLEPTIKNCLENAKNPENLIFGICRQYHPEDKFDELLHYRDDERFKIIDVLYTETKGACWARNKIQQLYNEEEYTLQLDSHMRFEKNWDETLIEMYQQLKNKGIKKPLLTSYVSSFDPTNDPQGRVNVPWRMVFDKFIPEGAVFFLPETIPNWQDLTEPVPARFYSAHFCFTSGDFAKNVQHNPEFYFHGEEISIAVRAYTHGYDLFHPHKVVIWHEYTRNGRTKHWDDDKEWWKLNESAHLLNRKLFGMDNNQQEGHEGSYGFGKERTLRDYEKYSGLLFEKRAVQQYTLDKKYPPNPFEYKTDQEWIDSFSKFMKFSIQVDKNKFDKSDYDFWAIIFTDDVGYEISRKDCNQGEIRNLMDTPADFVLIQREFNTAIKPTKWVVWPHSISEGWLERMEGNL